ncbi:MAG: nucleotidyl transferase AbiEii/AbiGii toxin family protein [Cyclobacteriaceae bacterium]|nr:nucleotidyl transferase AbiEii/AbiGii toxin family protein [Cyclobacteriaceae bacterium]
MIKPKIISQISNAQGVRPQQIEKDYIITWLLWGIGKHQLLNKALIFKGGTCLKKIHIEEYRFSEDMGFTLNPELETDFSNDEIYKAFDELFLEVKKVANINAFVNESSKDIHKKSGSLKFYIDYVGPLGGNGNHVKLDITRGERLEFEVEKRNVFNSYSDLEEEENFTITSYGLEEIVIEKMAALMGRTVPRDLYDFDYLTTVEGIELQDVYFEFQRKAKHKNLDFSNFVKCINDKKDKFERAWNENLAHQVKDLPKFSNVWRNIGKQFRRFEKIK